MGGGREDASFALGSARWQRHRSHQEPHRAEWFALINDYEQERDGKITFTGHGVFTYDPKADPYTLTWFDCMGVPPEVFKGRFDGDILKLAHGGPGCTCA